MKWINPKYMSRSREDGDVILTEVYLGSPDDCMFGDRVSCLTALTMCGMFWQPAFSRRPALMSRLATPFRTPLRWLLSTMGGFCLRTKLRLPLKF